MTGLVRARRRTGAGTRAGRNGSRPRLCGVCGIPAHPPYVRPRAPVRAGARVHAPTRVVPAHPAQPAHVNAHADTGPSVPAHVNARRRRTPHSRGRAHARAVSSLFPKKNERGGRHD